MSRAHVIASSALIALVVGGAPACHRDGGATGAAAPGSASASASAASAAMAKALGVDGGGLGGLEGLSGAQAGAFGLRARPPLVIPSGNAPPMPVGATPAEREKELVALVSGRVAPDALPAVPTDPGAEFDEGLRDRLVSPTRFRSNVTLGPAETHGAMPNEAAKRVLAGARWRLRSCYERARQQAPDLDGAMRLQIHVLAGGAVDQVEARPSPSASADVLSNADLKSCVERVLRGLTFVDAGDAGKTLIIVDATFSAEADTELH